MIFLFLLGHFKTMGGLDHILSYLFLMQLKKLKLFVVIYGSIL